MSVSTKELYELLPAIYRTRDAENGEPVGALLSVAAGQAAILEENIRQLYDDHFIETCASWVIPYIGDLVGSDAIYEIDAATTRRRAEVANAIGYRRRKGTLVAIEQVARDTSGRPAAAVEFFKRLVTTESMHHIRPCHRATVDVRRGCELDRIDSAFDTLNRTVDVRRIAPRVRGISDPDATPLEINLHGGGKFNIPDIGIYLWRWKAFQVTNAPSFPVDDRRYMFSPLGQNMPLFNALPTRDSFGRLTTHFDVPHPIRRREFHENIQDFYGPDKSMAIFVDGSLVEASQICCCNLSDGPGQVWRCTPSAKIAIDPELGRIQLGAGAPVPKQLRVNYHYGFPAEIGGGPYDRTASLTSLDPSRLCFVAVIGPGETPTLEEAIANWNHHPPGCQGLIILPRFERFDIDLTGAAAINLPPQSQLWILSAQLHPSDGEMFTYEGACVTLRGNIEVQGQTLTAGNGSHALPAGQLLISGLWLSGSMHILGGAADVQLMDCTLVPGISLTRSGMPISPGEPNLFASGETNLRMIRCITGPVGVSAEGTIRICSSIVDSGSRCGVAYAGADFVSEGADLHIEDSTVIGKVRVRLMQLASNTIFLAHRPRHDPWKAALWCSRKQAGCMRFCSLPADAIAPQCFHCLPDDPSREEMLLPKFITLQYGHPSYGLVSGDVPLAIWKGADNGSQIGVYNLLQETEGVRNIQIRIEEYLPFGLEAGIFFQPSRALELKPQYVSIYGLRIKLGDPCADTDTDDLSFVGIGAALI
jgi:Phage tail protein (Tail_P2_I)